MKNASIPAKRPIDSSHSNEQFYLAHKYRNAQVELNLKRQEAEIALVVSQSPELQEVIKQIEEKQSQLDEIYDGIKKRRSSTKSRSSANTKEKLEISKIRDVLYPLFQKRWKLTQSILKPSRDAVNAARKSIVAKYQEEEIALAKSEGRNPIRKKLKDGEDWRHAIETKYREFADIQWEFTTGKNQLNREYSKLGLGSGTRGHIDQSLQAKSGKPPATNFKRWDGCGHIHVKMPSGTNWNKVSSGECSCVKVHYKDGMTLLEIFTHVRESLSLMVPVHRDQMERYISDPERKITDIALIRNRVGQTDHYRVQITVDSESQWTPPPSGMCGIDFGWRRIKEGLRVATLTGSSRYGESHQVQLVLPEKWLQQLSHCKDIQSERDTSFEEIKEKIQADESIPEEVRDAAKPQSRSTQRLSNVLMEWDDRPEWLERWRKWNKRKENEQRHLSLKVRRRRESLYRNFARWVSQRFEYVSHVDQPLKVLHQKRDIAKEHETFGSKEYRNFASLHQFKQFLKEALADKDRLTTVKSSEARMCPNCTSEFKHSENLIVQCGECGTIMDQDAATSTYLALEVARSSVNEDSLSLLDFYRQKSCVKTWELNEMKNPGKKDLSKQAGQI